MHKALIATAAAVGAIAAVTMAGPAQATSVHATHRHPAPPPASSCQLANGIKHVVQIEFDNVHLTRDNPNVPSDLEQMPALYNFLKNNGVVLANTHDVLVHTATNFISTMTGLYPDRTDITQSNSGSYFAPDGSTHTDISFGYWTDPLVDPAGNSTDTRYNLAYTADRADVPNSNNVNVPAPWVPYTRAGCNVGYSGMANAVLENVTSDVANVFGPNSPQAAEAQANPVKAAADFEGFAVHCAAGSPTCASGQTDALPDEPGGYNGFKALYGNAEIQPVISPSGPITALDGSVIQDASGNVGFPGFDSLTPTNSLAYAATMLEHNVPVVNAYVSDAHGDHTPALTGDLGPGEATYEQQLHDYNTAFAQFIARLAQDGITPANTLFTVTTDEGDHFSGSAPTPTNCTGLNGNLCSYATKSEVNVNLRGLLATQHGDTTSFAMHSDPAPALWVTGNPAPSSPQLRQLERNIGNTDITNPLTGQTDQLAYQLADPVEEKILHFVGADAARTPSLTFYSGEDEFVTNGAQNCNAPCVFTSSGFAWNHGGLWPDMQNIFSAYVGPGVKARGIDTKTFADQTDMRPTVLALTGLHDDYPVDGRVLTEELSPNALPVSMRSNRAGLLELGRLYKQVLATTGQFDMQTLAISTRALESGGATDDSEYTRLEALLANLDSQRDALADQMRDVLLGAAFDNQRADPHVTKTLSAAAESLLAEVSRLAG
jgi:hypothetical protein